jgi:hypothetical protein
LADALMATIACRNNPVSLLESAQALDDVLAAVPQRGRERAAGCCYVCFLESMALHLGVGVLWRTQIFQLSEYLSSGSGPSADLGGVVGPVAGGCALPVGGDFDVDAEHAGEDGGGQVGGELEQCGGAGWAGVDAVLA